MLERLSEDAYEAMVQCDSADGTYSRCEDCPAHEPCFLSAGSNCPVFALFKAEREALNELLDTPKGDAS